jgi:ArsR family transcriptional regulator
MTDLCNEIEKLGKGIGNANRYRILEVLMKGPQTVSHIVKQVELSQPAVSQHLKALKEYNLVTDTKEGQEVYYSINVAYTTKLLTSLVSSLNKQKKKH